MEKKMNKIKVRNRWKTAGFQVVSQKKSNAGKTGTIGQHWSKNSESRIALMLSLLKNVPLIAKLPPFTKKSICHCTSNKKKATDHKFKPMIEHKYFLRITIFKC